MMDQDKKVFSNFWKYVLVVLAYTVVVYLISLASANKYAEYKMANLPEDETPEFSFVLATPNHASNTCSFSVNGMFSETVHVIYAPLDPENEVLGSWYEDLNVILLTSPDGLTVQTVAHEVSHMVDTFMLQQPDIDPHYEAYMQGYWTECVYDIVREDAEWDFNDAAWDLKTY